MNTVTTSPSKPKLVVIGAGFGGLAAIKALQKADLDITVIDKRNHHLFQPLLYQVATAGLSPSDIAWPIRNILKRQANCRCVLGDVTHVDADARQVHIGDSVYPYDYLIVATGARHSYFGKDEWEPFAPGLKRIIDATEIRKRVLMAFEKAETCTDPVERRAHLTFLIIGGGPTGVEMAGSIAELARHALASDFRHIDPSSARIILAEAGDRVLSAFKPELSVYAQKALEDLGVEIALHQRVTIDGHKGAIIGDEPIGCSTMIWAAGVYVPRVANWFGVETDPSGRVPVNADLTLADHPEVFVIGDAAKVAWQDGAVPGIAPAAKQGGKHVAKTILARLDGQSGPGDFEYRHHGDLATIGRHAAVVDFGKFQLKGWMAWWFWGVAHIYFLIGVRAPLIVGMQWFWSYLTFGKGARLITGVMPLFGSSSIEPPPQKSPAE
ncbi:MAG: NAD(P)/FAD-dependent oxidoreductase [Pseudomonadota bacterium]